MAALAALVLTGCAATPSGVLSAPGRSVVSATAARLDALQRLITGDVAEKRASEVLNYRRVEGGVAACMQAAGRLYRMPAFVSSYRGFTDADLGYGIGHATVFDSVAGGVRPLVLNELTQARRERAGISPETVPVADVPVYNTCTAPFEHRTYYDVDPPEGAYDLAAFTDLLPPVASDPAVVAALAPYGGCMKQRYGYDVTDRDDFLFKDRLVSDDAPADGAAAKPAWTSEVAALDAAVAADADCRGNAYQVAMTLLAPRLAPWEAKHRAQLDAIHTQWRQRLTDAATSAPGWPTTGPEQ